MMKKWGLLRFRRKRNAADFCFSTHIRLKRNRNFYSPVSLLMIFNRFHQNANSPGNLEEAPEFRKPCRYQFVAIWI